jgi:hypothetical protein
MFGAQLPARLIRDTNHLLTSRNLITDFLSIYKLSGH